MPRVVHTEGCYSHGKVSVSPLPPEMYGDGSRHTWPIRRIEGVVSKDEAAEHMAREMLKVGGRGWRGGRGGWGRLPWLLGGVCLIVAQRHCGTRLAASAPRRSTPFPRTRAQPLSLARLRPAPQLPASLRLEPLKLAGAGVLRLSAGATLPESTAEVLSGTGQRLSRSFFDGHKQGLRVVGLG